MEVNLTPEQNDFVRHAVDAGRFGDPSQAVQEALALWVERERRRAEMVVDLDAAEASLARGEGIAVTRQSMTSLTDEVMARCAARVSAERAARS